MSWPQRLKRVFNIDIETCSACGGHARIIACIEDPVVIKRILDHLKTKTDVNEFSALPASRAPKLAGDAAVGQIGAHGELGVALVDPVARRCRGSPPTG